MEDDRISYHESIRIMYQRIKQDGMTNIWDRFEAQGIGGNPDQRCPFCLGGRSAISVPMDHVELK